GGGGGGESKLFSILPPKSILANDSSGEGGTVRGVRGDSLLISAGGGLEGQQGDRYQSLAGLVGLDSLGGMDKDEEGGSVFAETQQGGQQFNRSRGVRPFSPQPQHVRMNPDRLLGTSVEVDHDGGLVGMEKKDDDEGKTETDDEEAHPWRNEGLRKRRSSSSLASETGNLLLRDRSLVSTSLGEPQERVGGGESSWSVADTERNSP
ncbi:uncharacterized protein PODANS_1_19500, partial [Podospora anserina S mat+]